MKAKKIYHYFFYKLYRFWKSLSDDALNKWKPVITIMVLKVFILLQIIIWYGIITKKDLLSGNPVIFALPIALVLTIWNYYYFLHNDKWKSYIDEFEEYSRRRKFIGGFLTFLVILFITGGLIFSFYRLSILEK